MKIDIKLTRYNRQVLRKLCLNLFPYFDHVRVSKSGVVFKRKWYSLKKMSSHVAELVLLEIPNALNTYYQEKGFTPIFPNMRDLYFAVNHIEPLLAGGDVISFLYYKYNDVALSVTLREDYTFEPICTEDEEIVIEESKLVKDLVIETLEHYVEKISTIIERFNIQSKVIYFNSDFSCKSPPIRAPGDLRLTA